MAETFKTAVAVIGVDIGENSFHVVGLVPPALLARSYAGADHDPRRRASPFQLDKTGRLPLDSTAPGAASPADGASEWLRMTARKRLPVPMMKEPRGGSSRSA